jgi:hypothetical protein
MIGGGIARILKYRSWAAGCYPGYQRNSSNEAAKKPIPKKNDVGISGSPTDNKTNGTTFLKNSPVVILSPLKGLGAKPISGSWTEDADPKITSKKYNTARTSKIDRMIITMEYSTFSISDE